jgi:hypothetical protein
MASGATTAFGLHRQQVEGMVAAGQSFPEVESAIECTSLPADERDALWLFAWALRGRLGPSEQRLPRLRPVTVP